MKTHIRFILLGTLLSLNISMPLAAYAKFAGGISGVPKATKVIKTSREDVESGQTDKASFQKCHIFPKFLAIEVDSNQKGALSIAIRKRGKNKDIEEACRAIDWPGDMMIVNNEQYVLGARGHFLFTISADGFGDSGTIWIYDAENGKLIYDAPYSLSQKFSVLENHNNITIRYHKQLKLSCSLATEPEKCWNQILKENEIPSSVKVQLPNCKVAYESADFKKSPKLLQIPEAVQIFTPVVVEDLDLPIARYLDAKPICFATP